MNRKVMQQAIFDLKRGERVSLSPREKMELFTLALRATDPDIVLVPREPTQDMMAAAMNVKGKYVPPGRLYAFYSAMIAAARRGQQ